MHQSTTMSGRETMGESSGDGTRHQRVVVADGGRLPMSPRRFLEEPGTSGLSAVFPGNSERRESSSRLWDRERGLGSNDQDYYLTYIVDKNGNEYEPYALAWRYLGMYMDCEKEDCADESGGDCDDDRRRTLRDDRHLGGSNDEGGNCERMLLWAAYVDHQYTGHSIGGYQFYDVETGEYDQSMCQTQSWKVWDRCKRLDCHDLSPTNFELIGVFKETDGLSDWAEQLFKHQAYCVWDEDTYESMQTRRERWPTQCWQLYYYYDSNGNSLYVDLKPLPEGNVTMGMYTDDKCSQVADVTWFDYVSNYYNRYGDSEKAEEAIERWNQTIQSWNDGMTPFKKCQPCRAYNLNATSQGGSEYGEQGSHDRQERWLGEDNGNDGEGGEEQNGYDCYDDAGYTNCNQCYKFFAKTDLEPASADDLARASGTILSIRVDGVLYGSGGFRSPPAPESYALLITGAALGIAAGLLLVAVYARYRHRTRVMPQALKEELVDGGTDGKAPKRKKKKTDGREADTDNASAYTEYTTSYDDDDSRGGENFKATRLPLSRSIERVSTGFFPERCRSRRDREDVAMTPTRTTVYLLAVSVSQRLDTLVDYIMPLSSPEETGAESNDGSYVPYEDMTSFPGDDEDEETGYTSNSDEEKPRTGGTWIELPLHNNKEEDVEVSSIEGLTTEVSSDGEERRPQTQRNGLLGPHATQNSSSESSFSSGSEASSSSAYETPDEAVLYYSPRTGVEAPVVKKQHTSVILATDGINTRCSAISEGSVETDVIAINTMKEENDDKSDAVKLSTSATNELITSPTNETGDTAKVQKSACHSCLTSLALDSYPSNEPKDSTDTRNKWEAGHNLQPSPTPSGSLSNGNKSSSEDELTQNVPTFDELDNGNDETKSDLAGNERKALVLAELLLVCQSKEQTSRTDALEELITGGRQSNSISCSRANGNESDSLKKFRKGHAIDETKSDGVGNERKEGVEQSRLLTLDLSTVTSDSIVPLHVGVECNDFAILPQTDTRRAVIHDDDHVVENEAEQTQQNDGAIRSAETSEAQRVDRCTSGSASTGDIDLTTDDIDGSSQDCIPLIFDPSGIYDIDSDSLLDDPSGSYNVTHPSFLSSQPMPSNAAIWANSILATTDEEEERDGDGGSYRAVNDSSIDDDCDGVMTESPSENPEGSSAIDSVTGRPIDQSCSTSCWALLALDEDDSPGGTLPPASTATTTISDVNETSIDDDNDAVMTESPSDNPEGSSAIDSVTGRPIDQSCSTSCWALLALDEDDSPGGTIPPAATATTTISDVEETSIDDGSDGVMTESPSDNPEGSSAIDSVACRPSDQSGSTSCSALLALDEDESPVGTLPPASAATTTISDVNESISDAIGDIGTEADEDDAHDAISNDEKSLSSTPPTLDPELVLSHNEISGSDNVTGGNSKKGSSLLDPAGEPAKLWLQTSTESILQTTSHFEVSHLGTNVNVGEEEVDEDAAVELTVNNTETNEPTTCGTGCLEYFALD